MEERKRGRTLKNINITPTIAGMTVSEWVILMSVCFFLYLLHKFLILPGLLILFSAQRHLKKQRDKGHPDYISSLFNSLGRKRYFEDKENVLKQLENVSNRTQ